MLALGGCLWTSPSPVRSETASPAQVKEGLLYHLSLFVRWPEPKLSAREPIVLAVCGEDREGIVPLLLARAKRLERTNKRRLRVVHLEPNPKQPEETLAQLRSAHLVYAPPSADGEHLRRLRDSAVLLVGEGKTFAQDVGMVGLHVRAGEGTRIFVNLARAKRANLRLSAQLLRHAEIVGER